MVSKTILILAFVSACLAIPVEKFKTPVTVLEPRTLGPVPTPGEPQGAQPEENDLNTDASRWWSRSYYPSYPVYRRYYYNYPSVSSYYTPSYSYWNSYW